HHPVHLHWDVILTSLTAVAIGGGLAWLMYAKHAISAEAMAQRFAPLHRFLVRRYRLDELYAWYVETIQQRIIAGACALFERWVIIDFAVNGTARLTKTAGHVIRYCQTGKIQTYVLVFFAGVVALLCMVVK
ncbi:MAG: NADH-quinone oxidoreductase subunit L, partial [Candidatus Omnitrophica bacterium]|nr:NADH-quinone oxidoreductase subunit L [Candidatus Omnitrophota bacterium]